MSGSNSKTENKNKTEVGHCKANETDVYIGRGKGGKSILNTEPGKRGWLGNPFPLDEYTREESIKKFRKVFEEKLENDEEFKKKVAELSGKTLGCWCQGVNDTEPACHGEVIAEHADRLSKQLN